MNIRLAHFDLRPLVYGVIMPIGIAMLWRNLSSGRCLSLAIENCVFDLVFGVNRGAMAGEFATMVASLLAGLLLPVVMPG